MRSQSACGVPMNLKGAAEAKMEARMLASATTQSLYIQSPKFDRATFPDFRFTVYPSASGKKRKGRQPILRW